jgi:hypothetical protein
VRVTLDLLNLQAGSYNIEPIVDVFANDVEVRSVQPGQVRVIITAPFTETEEISQTLPQAALTLEEMDALIFSVMDGAPAAAAPPLTRIAGAVERPAIAI